MRWCTAAFFTTRFIEKLLNGRGDDGEHIIVEVEVNDVLKAEPLRIIEPAALLEHQGLERSRGEEEPDMLAHPTLLRMRGDILVLADLVLHLCIKTELLLDNPRDAHLRRRILFNMPLRERPPTEDVVHKREIILPVVLGIDDGAAHLLERELLSLHLLAPLLVLTRLAELLVNGAKDPVDEAARGVAAEGLGEFDGLVDGDLRRDLGSVGEEELVEPEPQKIAVDRRDAFKGPLGRSLHDDEVDVFFFSEYAEEELLHERLVGVIAAEFGDIAGENSESILVGCVCRIPFKKCLENNGAR